MNPVELSDEAKAVLLFCGRFQKGNDPKLPKPLNLREYNLLAQWLHNSGLRPKSLLTEEGLHILKKTPPDINITRIQGLIARGGVMALSIEKWHNAGIWVVCRSDPDYPARLKRHLNRQAPPVLYGIGDIQILSRGGLAIVGSRNVDEKGEAFTQTVAQSCAQQNIQVVSGGARGVDQIAMLAALNHGGFVAGALADSLLKSAVAKKYRDFIQEKRLCLVSAFAPDSPFHVGNAMGRNKHIYGLADFALIISAEKNKGGTWAGATEELKRKNSNPVFVRNAVDSPSGNHAFLKLGAHPFPSPPWDKNLEKTLKNSKRGGRQSKIPEQRSLFPDMHQTPFPTTAIREATNAYQNDPIRQEVPSDIFGAALPLILNALKDWRTPKNLSEILEIRKPQLDDWLKRARMEGWIERKIKPVRYRRAKS